MAQFQDHLQQTIRNLKFLENINLTVTDCYDWQVTVCFYAALHLVNAHLSHFGIQYRKHSDVNHALNPYTLGSLTKLPDDEFSAYISLQSLSRRSRYLVNEKNNQILSTTPALTYEKHLAKALRHLDKLIIFFNTKYNITTLPQIKVVCSDIKAENDLNFLKKST